MIIERGPHPCGRDVPATDGRTTSDLGPHAREARATAGGPVDVRWAVEAAHAAFPSWSALSPSTRGRIVLKAADVLEARVDEVAATMAAEAGGATGWAHFTVALAGGILREAAAAATRPVGDVPTTDVDGRLTLAVREPVGVVAAFAPWNAPVVLGTRAIATPMAVGNTVVLKPGEGATIPGGLFLADVLREAGLPDGVLNVVADDRADTASVAEALIADDRVRAVDFTGSARVGRIVRDLAARRLTPAVLDLGGKNAVLVLDDADLDHAVDAVAFGGFAGTGRIRVSADRVLVHASIAEEFTARLAAKVARLPHGDPTDPATAAGAVIDPRSARHVADLVADAVEQGARVRARGGEPDGARYPATVLDRVTPSMRIHHDGVVGPVVTVIAVADDEEAVALANDTGHGSTAGVLTGDTRRGLAVARRLRMGIAHVGDRTPDLHTPDDQIPADEPRAPCDGVAVGGCVRFGGCGRFDGLRGVEAFTTTRRVTIAGTPTQFPF